MGETTSPFNAGFRRIDRDGMLIGLWYPTEDEPETVWRSGIHDFQSIEDGRAALGTGKLVAISHGTGGWYDGHHDTAEALARAGYWSVAPTHPQDNVEDTSGFGAPAQLIERPAHIRRALSAALREGPELDREQLGFFGFSAGGYTGLCLLGGRPVFERLGVLSNEGSTLVFPDDIAARNLATIEDGRSPEAEQETGVSSSEGGRSEPQ